MKKTQYEIVKEKLGRDGYVSNFWAISHYILRLGAIIKVLRDEGIEIEGMFGAKLKDAPKGHDKNFYYFTKRNVYLAPSGMWVSNVKIEA